MMPVVLGEAVGVSGARLCELRIARLSRVPTENATVIRHLKEAGGILLAKLNLTEFALGGTRQFPFGQPRNPQDVMDMSLSNRE